MKTKQTKVRPTPEVADTILFTTILEGTIEAVLGENKVLTRAPSGELFLAQRSPADQGLSEVWHGEDFIVSEADAKAIRKLGLPLTRLAENNWQFAGQ